MDIDVNSKYLGLVALQSARLTMKIKPNGNKSKKKLLPDAR